MEQNENNVDQAILPLVPELPKVTLKMSVEEVLAQVETYKTNADASLAKLQQGIEKQTEQLSQLQKMQLMIMGQRELVTDLLNKMTGGNKQSTGV